MGIIQLLDTATTNKIAAGEVVADPASVVKELVENSLDAGSTRISVEITGGGIDLIKVSDNGCGISHGDIEASFLRHATSKIRTFNDLETVESMGFRGEALASIAAVCRVTLTSRARGEIEGCRMTVEGGVSCKPAAVGCAEGTTVEAANLFFNVPVRRKFLKSTGRETAAVNEVVSRLALGHPRTAFKLKNDGKLIFETYGSNDLLAAIAAILGKDSADHLIPVFSSSGEWDIKGYISKPFYTRSSRKFQYFYINQRWVANPSLRYALDHAYRTLVPKGRYPLAVLYLETKKPSVDVNVDPTKNTVRINNEKAILDFLVDSVRNALSNNRREKEIVREKGRYLLSDIPIASVYVPPHRQAEASPADAGSKTAKETSEVPLCHWHSVNIPGDQDILNYTSWACSNKALLPFKVLAQLAASYILYEKGNNLYIIDQHAAHERIRYETLIDTDAADARQLVIPQTICLSPRQVALVEQLSEHLAKAGFQFDFFGGSFIVLREIPVELSFADPEAAFLELLELTDENLGSTKNLQEAMIMSLACKTSVKAGQTLAFEEMESLIQELNACKDPLTCPHGRPTTICISEGMLMKEFERK